MDVTKIATHSHTYQTPFLCYERHSKIFTTFKSSFFDLDRHCTVDNTDIYYHHLKTRKLPKLFKSW